jgi:hypothetical protein
LWLHRINLASLTGRKDEMIWADSIESFGPPPQLENAPPGVARLTLWLKREAARVTQWSALDEHYAVGEFSLQLLGWAIMPRKANSDGETGKPLRSYLLLLGHV